MMSSSEWSEEKEIGTGNSMVLRSGGGFPGLWEGALTTPVINRNSSVSGGEALWTAALQL
jgi:hypothetical protein